MKSLMCLSVSAASSVLMNSGTSWLLASNFLCGLRRYLYHDPFFVSLFPFALCTLLLLRHYPPSIAVIALFLPSLYLLLYSCKRQRFHVKRFLLYEPLLLLVPLSLQYIYQCLIPTDAKCDVYSYGDGPVMPIRAAVLPLFLPAAFLLAGPILLSLSHRCC